MKRTIWTFGLIAGAIMSAMMLATIPFADKIGFDASGIIGYATMVLAFLLVYFGILSYRDTVAGGTIGFGRAFTVGILITVVACACYVVTWEFIYYKITPDFADKYASNVVEKTRADGASQEKIDAKIAEMQHFKEMYENPFYNAALTFTEPFPVGLVIALVCAGILRKKPDELHRASSSVSAVAT